MEQNKDNIESILLFLRSKIDGEKELGKHIIKKTTYQEGLKKLQVFLGDDMEHCSSQVINDILLRDGIAGVFRDLLLQHCSDNVKGVVPVRFCFTQILDEEHKIDTVNHPTQKISFSYRLRFYSELENFDLYTIGSMILYIIRVISDDTIPDCIALIYVAFIMKFPNRIIEIPYEEFGWRSAYNYSFVRKKIERYIERRMKIDGCSEYEAWLIAKKNLDKLLLKSPFSDSNSSFFLGYKDEVDSVFMKFYSHLIE